MRRKEENKKKGREIGEKNDTKTKKVGKEKKVKRTSRKGREQNTNGTEWIDSVDGKTEKRLTIKKELRIPTKRVETE